MSELHVVKTKGKRKILKPVSQQEIQNNLIEGIDGQVINSQHTLISMLLPPAVKAFFADLESLIKMKEAAGRPKDLEDLKYLRELKKT